MCTGIHAGSLVSYNCHKNMQFYTLLLQGKDKVAVVLLATMVDVAIPAISFSQNNLARYQTGLHIRCKKYCLCTHINGRLLLLENNKNSIISIVVKQLTTCIKINHVIHMIDLH